MLLTTILGLGESQTIASSNVIRRSAKVGLSCAAIIAASGLIWRDYHIRPQSVSTAKFLDQQNPIDIAVVGDSFLTDLVSSKNDAVTGLRCLSTTPMNCVTGKFNQLHPISVYERLELKYEFRITNYSRPAAYLLARAKLSYPDPWMRKLIGIPTLDDQISNILQRSELPNLIVVFTGHNDIMYSAAIDEGIDKFREEVSDEYQAQVRRVIERAKQEPHRTAIIIVSPLDWRIRKKLADQIEGIRLKDSEAFREFQPAKNFDEQLQFAQSFDRWLAQWVSTEARALKESNVSLILSDSLRNIPLNVDDLNEDGIHGTKSGWNKLAEGLTQSIESALPLLRSRESAEGIRPSMGGSGRFLPRD